jgi:hypothetical protein
VRAAAIAREAWRNVLSGTARAGLLLVVFAAVVVGAVALQLTELHGIQRDAQAYRDAGASVLVLAAPDRVDGAACAALSGVSGVQAAGALREAEPLRLAALPGSTVPIYEVTPGLPRVLRARVTGAGLVLADEVVEATGATHGDRIPALHSGSAVGGTYAYPPDGRRSGLGYAALAPTTVDGLFDECWVDVWPETDRVLALLRATVTTDPQRDVTVSQLNAALGTRFDAAGRLDGRVTRLAAPVAFVAACGLGVMCVRSRRLQHASALHAGVRKSELAVGAALETVVWAAPGAIAAAAVAMWFAAAGNAADAAATTLTAAGTVFACLAGIGIGQAGALVTIRQSSLFRYFADR